MCEQRTLCFVLAHAHTVHAEIAVEHLEERKAVPSVGRLFGEDCVHVDGEQGPEDFAVLDEEIGEPSERLRESCDMWHHS